MLSILSNQPLAFNLNTAEKCNTPYFLPVQKNTDGFMLQGFSAQTGHHNLVDPTAWTLGTNYSVDTGGTITYSGSLSNYTAASNALGLTAGGLYQVLLTVVITGTYPVPSGDGIVLSINGDNIPLPGALAACNHGFQLSWYYSPAAINNNRLIITTNFPAIQFVVENIEVVQYSIPALLAYDVADNYIGQVPASIHYFIQPLFNTGNATQCRFQIAFDLNTLAEGCYYLQLADTGAGAYTFDVSNFVAIAGWAISDDIATYTNDGNFNEFQQTLILLGGQQYTFQYNLATVQGLLFNLKVYFASTHVAQPLISESGNYTFTFTVPGTGLQPVVLSLLPGIPSGLTTAQIAALLGHQVQISNSILIFGQPQNNQKSNSINLRNAQPHTILFESTNADNAFNFDCSNALICKLRLTAKMKYHDYRETVEEYNFSDNSNLLLSATSEKIYEMTIADAPEFVHDCLSVMRLNDSFKANGLPYIREGNYTIRQRKSTELAPAAFNVKPCRGIGKNWAIH